MEDPYYEHIKKNWQNHKGTIFVSEPLARLGDLIEMTAILKYFKSLGIKVFYGDWSKNANATNLFRPDLCTIRNDVPPFATPIDILHPWVWAPYVKSLGIYTEVNVEYELSKDHKYDVVFVPCLEPEYHKGRGIHPLNAVAIFQAIKSQYKNCRMIVDKNKRHLVPSNDPDIYASSSMEVTFKFIENCKVYVGCDTGTSHYAGAIKHPHMALLYPDESVFTEGWLHKKTVAEIFNHPQLIDYEMTCIPGCNPKQYRVLRLSQNNIQPEAVLSILWSV